MGPTGVFLEGYHYYLEVQEARVQRYLRNLSLDQGNLGSINDYLGDNARGSFPVSNEKELRRRTQALIECGVKDDLIQGCRRYSSCLAHSTGLNNFNEAVAFSAMIDFFCLCEELSSSDAASRTKELVSYRIKCFVDGSPLMNGVAGSSDALGRSRYLVSILSRNEPDGPQHEPADYTVVTEGIELLPELLLRGRLLEAAQLLDILVNIIRLVHRLDARQVELIGLLLSLLKYPYQSSSEFQRWRATAESQREDVDLFFSSGGSISNADATGNAIHKLKCVVRAAFAAAAGDVRGLLAFFQQSQETEKLVLLLLSGIATFADPFNTNIVYFMRSIDKSLLGNSDYGRGASYHNSNRLLQNSWFVEGIFMHARGHHQAARDADEAEHCAELLLTLAHHFHQYGKNQDMVRRENNEEAFVGHYTASLSYFAAFHLWDLASPSYLTLTEDGEIAPGRNRHIILADYLDSIHAFNTMNNTIHNAGDALAALFPIISERAMIEMILTYLSWAPLMDPDDATALSYCLTLDPCPRSDGSSFFEAEEDIFSFIQFIQRLFVDSAKEAEPCQYHQRSPNTVIFKRLGSHAGRQRTIIEAQLKRYGHLIHRSDVLQSENDCIRDLFRVQDAVIDTILSRLRMHHIQLLLCPHDPSLSPTASLPPPTPLPIPSPPCPTDSYFPNISYNPARAVRYIFDEYESDFELLPLIKAPLVQALSRPDALTSPFVLSVGEAVRITSPAAMKIFSNSKRLRANLEKFLRRKRAEQEFLSVKVAEDADGGHSSQQRLEIAEEGALVAHMALLLCGHIWELSVRGGALLNFLSTAQRGTREKETKNNTITAKAISLGIIEAGGEDDQAGALDVDPLGYDHVAFYPLYENDQQGGVNDVAVRLRSFFSAVRHIAEIITGHSREGFLIGSIFHLQTRVALVKAILAAHSTCISHSLSYNELLGGIFDTKSVRRSPALEGREKDSDDPFSCTEGSSPATKIKQAFINIVATIPDRPDLAAAIVKLQLI